jgi:hypothetical protein
MALMNLVYRDRLFPREAYRRTFELLVERLPERQAARLMVDLLALAHDRACEAELAHCLEDGLAQGRLPDLPALRVRFGPDPARIPLVEVKLGSLVSYEALLGTEMIRGAP